jgi:hypothetical protein
MKTLRSVLSVLAVLLMATAAQGQQTKVHSNVPFDFFVGDRAYPAGDYTLKSVTEMGDVIRISNTQEDASANVIAIACEKVQPSTDTKLVFRHMGGYYFLTQVWTAGSSAGREFPRSRTEIRLAQNQEKSEYVIVAANITK